MVSQPRTTHNFVQRTPSPVSNEQEDAGLFKTGLCQIMIELIPQSRRSDRGDVIIHGFVDRKFRVEVFFAGRRVAEVGPLEARLRALMRAARSIAKATGNGEPNIEELRLPVRAEGAWRRTIKRDENGWETGKHHFVMARWSLLDQNGNTITYGQASAHTV